MDEAMGVEMLGGGDAMAGAIGVAPLCLDLSGQGSTDSYKYASGLFWNQIAARGFPICLHIKTEGEIRPRLADLGARAPFMGEQRRGAAAWMLTGPGAVAFLWCTDDSGSEGFIAADTPAIATTWRDRLLDTVLIRQAAKDAVRIDFWALHQHGPQAVRRMIEAPTWDAIASNYSRDTKSALARLMQIDANDGNGRLVLMSGPPGTGKAQPLDAPVLTPKGWSAIGELAVGDPVLGPDGSTRHVTAVHPQGTVPIYLCTFTDGAVAESCADHLWVTQTALDRSAKRAGSPKRLGEVALSLLDNSGKRNHFIPLVEPFALDLDTGLDRPLDPYLLGLLLGDGGFSGHRSVIFTSPDRELHEAVAARLPSGCVTHRRDDLSVAIVEPDRWHQNQVLHALTTLGLLGLKSVEKFIPAPYLWAPARARHALLQGLLDTDGYADPHAVEFATSSPRLAEGVRFLVESLGGTITQTERSAPTYTYNDERRTGARSWRIVVKLPPALLPFRLSRKAVRYLPPTKYLPRRAFASVEFSREAPAVCISLDAPDGLYVTSGFVVTHNTFAIRSLARTFAPWCRTHYIVDPEEFFGRAAYMVQVVLGQEEGVPSGGPDGGAAPAPLWKLLVIEDADELITLDAKQRSGQALGRLLNLTDGLVGQGLNVLVLITTNEPMDRFAPAVIRAGRCRANIEFGALSQGEADAWCATRHVERPARDAAGRYVLADLFRQPPIAAKRAARRVGFGG